MHDASSTLSVNTNVRQQATKDRSQPPAPHAQSLNTKGISISGVMHTGCTTNELREAFIPLPTQLLQRPRSAAGGSSKKVSLEFSYNRKLLALVCRWHVLCVCLGLCLYALGRKPLGILRPQIMSLNKNSSQVDELGRPHHPDHEKKKKNLQGLI